MKKLVLDWYPAYILLLVSTRGFRPFSRDELAVSDTISMLSWSLSNRSFWFSLSRVAVLFKLSDYIFCTFLLVYLEVLLRAESNTAAVL